MSAKAASKKAAKPIRVMIVDDHPMWRDTLRKVLELKRFADVVAEADDGEQSIGLAEKAKPDVVIMDVALPLMSGIDATARLLARRPDQRVLVLASSDEKDQVISAVHAGASGYLIKTARPDELRDAVKRVHEGELIFPPAVSGAVLQELRHPTRTVVATAGATTAALRREGEYWTINYGTAVFRLKDQKGLAYIAHLLRNPGRELHALDLAALTVGAGALQGRRDEGEARMSGGGKIDEILDPQAKETIRRHLADLDSELEEARSWGDSERAVRLENEIASVTGALSSAVGLGGRSREFASAGERARVNITRSIKAAVDRIQANCPPLGQHLAATLRTGTYCAYLPDGGSPSWRL